MAVAAAVRLAAAAAAVAAAGRALDWGALQLGWQIIDCARGSRSLMPEFDSEPALWRCRYDGGDVENLVETKVRGAAAAAQSQPASLASKSSAPAADPVSAEAATTANSPSPGGSCRKRRPASASLVQAIAMCQHNQRIMAERRAQAKSICAALLGKRVIVQWKKDEAYAGEAAAGSSPTSGEYTILVKYDDGEEIWETVEPGKFREIPSAHQHPACETCGGDDLAKLQFCAGCEAAHHEDCEMHAVSIICGRKTTLQKEWYCGKCTAKQAGCKACKGGHSTHTCDDGPWRVRHSRNSKSIWSRTPGAARRRPSAYRLPNIPGSSPRSRGHTRALSFGGNLLEEKWTPEEDDTLRLLVER